jgi:hypothetical protein
MMVRECFFGTCGEPAIVEAIRSYDDVYGIEETVALELSERHAEALADELVVVTTES